MKHLLLSLAVLCMIAGSASAALLGADNFEEYTVGGVLLGQTGGTGWEASSQWGVQSGYDANYSPKIVSKSMSYSGGNVVCDGGDKAIRISTDDGQLVHPMSCAAWRNLPSAIEATSGATVYVSFLVQTTGVQDPNYIRGAARYAYLGLDDDESSSSQLAAGVWWDDTADNSFWYNKSGSSSVVNQGQNVYTDDQTWMIVFKATSDGTSWTGVKLFVNPTSTSTEGGTYEVTNTGTWDATVDQLNIRQWQIGPWGSTELDRLYYDNVKVGTTWGDVVVPEPATLALLSLGGVAALIRKRR